MYLTNYGRTLVGSLPVPTLENTSHPEYASAAVNVGKLSNASMVSFRDELSAGALTHTRSSKLMVLHDAMHEILAPITLAST